LVSKWFRELEESFQEEPLRELVQPVAPIQKVEVEVAANQEWHLALAWSAVGNLGAVVESQEMSRDRNQGWSSLVLENWGVDLG
jgi:hypothetical protein